MNGANMAAIIYVPSVDSLLPIDTPPSIPTIDPINGHDFKETNKQQRKAADVIIYQGHPVEASVSNLEWKQSGLQMYMH